MALLADSARAAFSPTPSRSRAVRASVAASPPDMVTARGLMVGQDGPLPAELGLDRHRLRAAGFEGRPGEVLVVPAPTGPVVAVVGLGDLADVDAAGLRDAAGAFARATASHSRLTLDVPEVAALAPDLAGQALIEGVVLARYRYEPLKRTAEATDLAEVVLVAAPERLEPLERGAQRGLVLAAATELARDLANTPHSHLNASTLATIAEQLAGEKGLDVEVFDEAALEELGCGGLLGVNAGSVEPARMVKLTYTPPGPAEDGAAPHLTFVGKGLMYDSGGLSLKPGDEVHAQMKNDMSGAAAVLAAMVALPDLACPTAATGYLMCTDNMPSGTAMALGDVITIRGGTTVEVVNTDAEGRLVMADALVLATEEPTDAIVDIATLTGACMRALGTSVAGVLGTSQPLVDQVVAAAAASDEPVWQLPLERRYRPELDSGVADLKNLGGANAGAITAALFLAEFVGDTPWAHLDIAGTAQQATDASWRTKGCSGFGARLLVELAMGFTAPPVRAEA